MQDVYFDKPPSPEGAICMSFRIWVKTEKSLQQLASEMRDLFSLPPFKQSSFSGEPYCQFEMLGLLMLIHPAEQEDDDPEVIDYPYCFDMQMSFADHELDTDDMEYRLQPYYAELLSFQLGIDTAYHEKQKVGHSWRIRYHFCSKNLKWNGNILYGEPGWQPAILRAAPSPWRSMRPAF
jgi:hypothetical protein